MIKTEKNICDTHWNENNKGGKFGDNRRGRSPGKSGDYNFRRSSERQHGGRSGDRNCSQSKGRRDGSKPGFQGDCYKYKCNKPGHRRFECTSVENKSNGKHFKTLYFNKKDGGYYNDNKFKDKFQKNGTDK